jgi:hypothetical protein
MVFTPAQYLDIIYGNLTESVDESRCQTSICQQGYVEIDGSPTDLVAVGQLSFRQVLGNIDDQIDFFVSDHLQCF